MSAEFFYIFNPKVCILVHSCSKKWEHAAVKILPASKQMAGV